MLGTGLVKCIFVTHSLLSEVKMGAYYINYYFHNIEYDDGFYGGEFSAPDYRVYCKFFTIGKQRNLLISGTILNLLMKFFQFQFGGLIISLKRMGSLVSMKAK